MIKVKANRFPRVSLAIFLTLCGLSWIHLISDTQMSLIDSDIFASSFEFLGKLVGKGLGRDAAGLSWESWSRAFFLGLTTVKMSILAIGMASLPCLLMLTPATRTLVFENVEGSKKLSNKFFFYVFKGLFTLTRSIPEVVWVMVIIFVLRPGIFTGALALAIHNFGVLGRLSSEVVENMDEGPIRSLRASGASTLQVLFYGVIPEVLPKFLTYVLYRWEVIIRTTVVVGVLAADGLGRQFRLSMSWFHYDDVGVLIMSYIILVLIVDAVSAILRRLSN